MTTDATHKKRQNIHKSRWNSKNRNSEEKLITLATTQLITPTLSFLRREKDTFTTKPAAIHHEQRQ